MEKRIVSLKCMLSFWSFRSFHLLVCLFLFGMFTVTAPAAYAANIIVNSLSDSVAVDTDCTLREAIQNANDDAATNTDCVAGTGTDTITFTLSGTITLGSTLPNITDTDGLTIDGTGQAVTISGNSTVRVMMVDANALLTVTYLTIANGNANAGAGIYNNGSLTATNSTFTSNSASVLGGALNNNGNDTLTVTNCTFTGNSAAGTNATEGGGAIYNNDGVVNITNSTFSGNSAVNNGGVINNYDVVTIINSTFSGNSAGNSAGGIFTGAGTVTLLNTIVANSTSGGNCSGTITNGGNNIEDGTTCGWDSTNGSMSNTNPMLGPLADNGGPTQTMALLTGSPAINGVTFNDPNSAPATDQRGVARPQGAFYDIGAYEYQAASAAVPTMNEWGMIIFMVIAGLGAILYLRRRAAKH